MFKLKIMERKVETSMKFFRQTKETKRKLSFFLALAMVISLLPVSPVAKAATSTKQRQVKSKGGYWQQYRNQY